MANIKSITQRQTTPRERARRRLLYSSQKSPETLLIQYDNINGGFNEEQVDDMQDQYGVNIVTKQKKETIFTKIFDAFINPFSVVLLVLSAFSFLSKDYPAVVIVLTMVLISGVLRFIQDTRSDIAAEKLSEIVETTAAVMRFYEDEEIATKREIPLDEIVVGDIIHLAAGDIIPADVRILQAKDLFISQSSLTGESEPVEKFSAPSKGSQKNPLELNNLAFMGSTVISGAGKAMVLAVGDTTYMGEISHKLQEKTPPTSFEKGISSVSWVLIRFMLVMVPVVLFIMGFTKNDWIQACLFAVSIAVGLTPEMLPMIVSANLAKGANSMAKNQVIVKELNSIQNFGAMDILCTDKTGTLTQDKIILEYHLDVHGNSDSRVLKHAYLNSYYQTGLKNLMDLSIIETAIEEGIATHEYKKVDEIPFDFSRRRMSVVVEDKKGKTQLITKGAIEEMLSISSFVDYEGKVIPLTEELHEEIMEKCNGYNADGLRVLGVAQKTNPAPEVSFSVKDESEMVLIGYLAFLDPPKDSSVDAIATLEEYGVSVKVLTGDNDAVTRAVCKQVGITVDKILLGSDIEEMTDAQLKKAVEEVNVFAKLAPACKARIVSTLRENGHVVGYMGDGINDAAAMKAADVGVSVDTAVDIAKESANIILLEKDLMVLENGVVEGRKIYGNIVKYIKMTASSNFGNMFSVLIASIFLPFLPMLPIQLLLLNLSYDLCCTAMPWDSVDKEFLAKPQKWEASFISKFMLWLGPVSSIFDITTFLLMFYIICPMFAGIYSLWNTDFVALFQAGWFVESMWTQILVIYMLRTEKLPFFGSRPSLPVVCMTLLGATVVTIIPFTSLGAAIGFVALPSIYFAWLAATLFSYVVLVTVMKKIFIKVHGKLL